MVTIGVIRELERLVKDTLDESRLDLELSVDEYEEELRDMYEQHTRSIQNNLNRVLDRLPKEHCDETQERFLRNMKRVQEALNNLNGVVEGLSEELNPERSKKEAAQAFFCRRILSFIETTASQIENMSKEALTIKEGIDPYFAVIRKDCKGKLAEIYNNLVEKDWIDGDYTSLGDFKHFFGGEGMKPRHCIKWNKPLTMLPPFLDLMTDDHNTPTKASKIFTICTDKDTDYHLVSKDSFKQSRYKALNNADEHHFFTYQDVIRKEIIGV